MITYKPYLTSLKFFILDKCVYHMKFSLKVPLLTKNANYT